ncbi:hypothetical protein HanXRQr2_Chr07g0280331 [Helianthus annuus]|uniref:Uncharacterized protein n=1 Tax=Helianthus annuus TaxID=4232 RepID=A0A9K3IJ86_HELAN|nr:hypothetical protein HanXRQr2_Chr07g0280331 [Helianthus annuus]
MTKHHKRIIDLRHIEGFETPFFNIINTSQNGFGVKIVTRQ